MSKTIELKIDPEFQSIIPPLTDEEFRQLRENILEKDEVINPILTWKNVIIDGHNRWKIVQDNPGIPFRTYEMIFADRNDAKEWIIKNQLGRRNITSEQRLRLIGKMQESRKQSHGGQVKGMGQNEPSVRSTAEAVAKEVGVSESTVKRAEKFSKGIDAIQEVSAEAANKILQGKADVTKARVMAVPTMDIEEKEEFVEEVLNPQPKEEKKLERSAYTIDNLVQEIGSNAETYLKFLKGTLVSRSTLYAEPDDRKRVLEAVSAIRAEIEKLEVLLT